jgi:hypothetical protein
VVGFWFCVKDCSLFEVVDDGKRERGRSGG